LPLLDVVFEIGKGALPFAVERETEWDVEQETPHSTQLQMSVDMYACATIVDRGERPVDASFCDEGG